MPLGEDRPWRANHTQLDRLQQAQEARERQIARSLRRDAPVEPTPAPRSTRFRWPVSPPPMPAPHPEVRITDVNLSRAEPTVARTANTFDEMRRVFREEAPLYTSYHTDHLPPPVSVAVDEEVMEAVRAMPRPRLSDGWAPMPSYSDMADAMTYTKPKPAPKTVDLYPRTLRPGSAWEFEINDGLTREYLVYRNDTDTEVVIPSMVDGVIMARNQKASR